MNSASKNPTHGTFEEVLEATSVELKPVCELLRTLVLSKHADAVEIAWPKQKIVSYGFGPKKNSDHYVYVAPQSKHVNFGFYRGAELDDPKGLLEGSGKQLRHVKLRSAEDAKNAALKKLLVAAIAERKAAMA